jgi:hypothetical protein
VVIRVATSASTSPTSTATTYCTKTSFYAPDISCASLQLTTKKG